MNRQTGFTLVEISIVLVIIGLILGAVLYNSGMLIGNTKATSTVKLITDLSGAVTDFKNRYHYLPGDLPAANAEFQNISAGCTIPISTPNIGNGQVDTAQEQSCVAEELVLGGFIKGSTTGIVSPFGTTPDVFVLAASNSAVNLAAANPFAATVQNVIEIKNLPCDAATEIDTKIDDGDPAKGNVRSTVCTNGAATLDVVL